MPFPSNINHLPRRNARSFDLDDSAAKAAAWVWHLHTSKPGVTTEGRFISSQSRRKSSSSSYDRKATRFRQEASATTNMVTAGGSKTEMPMWDCGSKLYDTFELVAFGNQLDRSLMEVVPITPPQAHLQEHHTMKSPLHEVSGILRTRSLSRSLSRQTSKHRTTNSSPSPNKLKLSNAYNNGTRESYTGSAQKGGTKWSRVGKFMNVIKKVVVLHKQVSFVGCKRSTNVIESSPRPLDQLISERRDYDYAGSQCSLNGKDRTNFTNRNNGDSECIGDGLSNYISKTRSINGTYKLSIPSKDKPDYVSSLGDKASMQKRIRACNIGSLGGGISMNKMIRSNSESTNDGFLEPIKIRSRRKSVGDEVASMDSGIKGSNLGGVNVKERIKGANHEHADHFKHLHHHHHHHHHHHYLHHNLVSESARLSPETMAQICAEQSWLN